MVVCYINPLVATIANRRGLVLKLEQTAWLA